MTHPLIGGSFAIATPVDSISMVATATATNPTTPSLPKPAKTQLRTMRYLTKVAIHLGVLALVGALRWSARWGVVLVGARRRW
jgi:hypothetical protein